METSQIIALITVIVLALYIGYRFNQKVKEEPVEPRLQFKPFLAPPEPQEKSVFWLEKNGYAFRCYLYKIVKNEAGKSMYLFREFNGIYHLRENLNRVFTAYDETQISPDISQLSKEQIIQLEEFIKNNSIEKPERPKASPISHYRETKKS